MRIKPGFEIVNIGDDYLAVPVGDETNSFKGVVALNEEAAFLLKKMREHQNLDALADLLTAEYNVDRIVALRDIEALMQKLTDMRIIEPLS